MTAKALHHLYPENRLPPGLTNLVLGAFTNAVLHCSSPAEVSTVLNRAIETAERSFGASVDELPISVGRSDGGGRQGPQEVARTQCEITTPDDLAGQHFTAALLARAEADANDGVTWMRETLGKTVERKPLRTLEARVASAVGTIAVGLAMRAADRAGVRLPLPNQSPTKETPVVAAFGLVIAATVTDMVAEEGTACDWNAQVSGFFNAFYLIHSPEAKLALARNAVRIFRDLWSADSQNVREWRDAMRMLAKCYVLQASTPNLAMKSLDCDRLASEMLRNVLQAVE
jgi:hypothetical protein